MFDARQYRLMMISLEVYQNGKIGLRQLISSLEGLAGVLEQVPEEWQETFYRKWGVLEEVYSVARDNKGEPDKESEHLIAQAIRELIKLIEPKLDSSFESPAD